MRPVLGQSLLVCSHGSRRVGIVISPTDRTGKFVARVFSEWEPSEDEHIRLPEESRAVDDRGYWWEPVEEVHGS